MSEKNGRGFWNFNIGNLITISIVVLGLAFGYGRLGAVVKINTEDIQRIDEDLEKHCNNKTKHYTIDSLLHEELRLLRKEIADLKNEVEALKNVIEKNGG